MSLLMGLVFIAATIFAIVSIIRAFWKSKRRQSLRNLGIAAAIMVASPIAGVYFQGQDDAAAGWRNSADKRLAAESGVTTAAIWYEQTDAVERERAAAAAIVAQERAAEDALAAEAKAKADEEARVAAAAEAERRAQAAEEAERVEAAAKEAEQAECRQELSCWAEEHLLAASFACDGPVEDLARYDFEWTDGFLGMKFSHYRWKDVDGGVVTYIGDQIKFQNGFGASQNHVYECDYDTVAEQPIEVRAEPGRL